MTRHRILFCLIAVMLVAAGCSGTDGGDGEGGGATLADPMVSTTASDDTTPPSVPPNGETGTESYAGTDPAPEFPAGLDWLNTDEPLTMASLTGKIVLLDFWTYGCINCIHIIPDLKRLEAEYAEELVVIGVHSAKFVNESATENIEQVVLRYDIEHPVVNDKDFAVWQSWGANAWPTTVLVDPAGNIVGGHSGEGVYDVVNPVIASLVSEFDATGGLSREPFESTLLKDSQPERVLSFPGKVEVATGDDRVFIADTGHDRIVTVDRFTGEMTAVFGDGSEGFFDGVGLGARFADPQGMSLSADGATLYVADTGNNAIRAVDTASGEVTTVLGTGETGWPPTGGVAPDVSISSPWDVLVDGDLLYIAMAGHHQIWQMDLTTGLAVPYIGSSREGVLNGTLDQAELAQPSGLAISDGRLYFADSESSSIRFADVLSPAGLTGLVAGGSEDLFTFGDEDGVGADARLQHPLGVVVWDDTLVVADTYNSKLKLINPVTGLTETLLGEEQGWEDGTEPRFYEPGGLAIDGDTLFVADTNNHVVRIVDLPSGDTSTLVLKGAENFTPPAGTDEYSGVVVDLGAVDVPVGPTDLVVDVTLPAGYKVNDEAPSSLVVEGVLSLGGEASADGGGGVFTAGKVNLTGTTLPTRLTATVTGGGPFAADLTLIYCQESAASLCLIEQVRFVGSIAAAGSASGIRLTHEVAAPPG